MGIDIKKFINDEGLSLERFGEWLETTKEDEEVKDPDIGKVISTKDETLVRKLIEGVKGKAEAKLILEEIKAGKAIVESSGTLLVVGKCKYGTFRVPRPMINMKRTEDGSA